VAPIVNPVTAHAFSDRVENVRSPWTIPLVIVGLAVTIPALRRIKPVCLAT
jgi:hypothetical protein